MKIISKAGKVKSNLRGKQKTLEHIIQNSSSMFYEHDLEGNFLFFSHQVKDYLGYSPEEIKMKWYELISDHQDNQIAFERTNKAIETGKKQPPYEIELVSKSGKKLWFEINETPFIENNEVVSIVGSLVDITEKKKSREKLKLSEEKFSKVFLNSPNAITISSLEDGRILEINDFGANELGYSREEMIGKTSLELGILTVEDRKIIYEELRKSGAYSGLELKLKTRSGQERIGLFYGQPIRIGDYEYLFQTIIDITKTKEAEKALKESEARYKKIYNSTSNSMVVFDINLNILDANPAACKMYGYSLHEMKSLSIRDIKAPEIVKKHRPTLKRLLKDKGHKEFESIDIRKNGEHIFTEVRLHILNYMGEDYFLDIINDITDRKAAEEALKLSEEKFSKAFFLSPDSISISEINSGKLIEVNEGFEKIFGYSREESLGKTTIELELYKNLFDREKVIQIIKSKGYVRNYEAEYKSKSNKFGFGEISSQIMHIGGKKYILTIVRDITERKIIEEEIKEYQDNLKILSSELTLAEERERRRIAVNLHDQLGQSLAMAKIKLSEALREIEYSNVINKAKAAQEYLNNSINDSRSITYELSPPVLYELGFSEAMKWQLDRVAEEYKIHVEFNDITSGLIDLTEEIRVLLFRAAQELINNIIKHSDATKLSSNLKNDENYLYFEINDNGKGFDLVQEMKNTKKKRSFGLFSIRERISYLNGKMNINSIVGEGTQVIIKIPYQFETIKKELK